MTPLLSVLRRALVIVQGPPEVASTAPTPLLYSGAKGRPRDAFPYYAFPYDAFVYDAFPYDAFVYC